MVSSIMLSAQKSKKNSGEELHPSTLQLVEIYFDTATFDDIERDKKIKTEAQLSLIGGTMGLLTGFSIMSGVEIIFFLFRSRTNLNVQTSSKTHPPFNFKYSHMLPTGHRYALPILTT